MDEKHRTQNAITVAKMYYLNGYSQDRIADEIGMSRSNVSRILKKCIADGLVEIIVHDSISERAELSYELSTAFGLKEVIIVPTAGAEDKMARNLGERLALYLEQILRNDMLLGIARGKACYYAGRNLKNSQSLHIDVIQLHGGTSSTASMYESGSLVSMYAAKLNGIGYILNAPLMVRSKRTKQELMENSMLLNTVKRFADVDVALFDIGQLELYARNVKREWLSKADLLQLSEVRAVSSICGYYFDRNGHPCNAGINDRIIAIAQEQIKNIECSIGIIAGKNALLPALSGIRSGLINVLVTDESLAFQLIHHIRNEE